MVLFEFSETLLDGLCPRDGGSHGLSPTVGMEAKLLRRLPASLPVGTFAKALQAMEAN